MAGAGADSRPITRVALEIAATVATPLVAECTLLGAEAPLDELARIDVLAARPAAGDCDDRGHLGALGVVV